MLARRPYRRVSLRWSLWLPSRGLESLACGKIPTAEIIAHENSRRSFDPDDPASQDHVRTIEATGMATPRSTFALRSNEPKPFCAPRLRTTEAGWCESSDVPSIGCSLSLDSTLVGDRGRWSWLATGAGAGKNGETAQSNLIRVENLKAGATDWQLTRVRPDKDGFRNAAIEGICG